MPRVSETLRIAVIVTLSLGICASAPLLAQLGPAPAAPSTMPATLPTGPMPADEDLAVRFSDLAQAVLKQKFVTMANWRLAGSLLDAAARLDPDNSRYPRLAADAYLQARDTESAGKALKAYAALEPDNVGVMIQRIDLYNAKYQRTDARLAYMQKLGANDKLAPEVRSHAYFRCAQAALDRAAPMDALNYLQQALQLNPVDMEALRLYYDMIAPTATPADRMLMLLAMLRANPSQPMVIDRIAQELANSGMVEDAIRAYQLGISAVNKLNMSIPTSFAMGYASELFISDKLEEVGPLINQILVSNPTDFDAYILRALVQRNGATDEARQATLVTYQGILNIAYNRILTVRSGIGITANEPRAVTDATAIQWPDFTQDIKILNEPGREAARAAYQQALADAIWCEVYFAAQPAAAIPLMNVLRQITDEKSPLLARLDGWIYLMSGKYDEAKVKLQAIAGSDPFAALGMIKLIAAAVQSGKEKDPKVLADVTQAAQQLFSFHPSGTLGCLLWDALRPMKIQRLAQPHAPSMQQALKGFPPEWLGFIEQPQNFYTIRADPLKIPHRFGEAVMARVTIENVNNFDITIGPEGALHPDLWFDVQVRGIIQQGLSGIAYDRLPYPMVLHPHQSVSQVVRLDQGQLSSLMITNPGPSLQLNFTVRTNPAATGNGIGPGGYSAGFARLAERTGYPMNQQAPAMLVAEMVKAGPSEKLQRTDLMNDLIGILISQNSNNQTAIQAAQKLLDAINRAAQDETPAVHSWAWYVMSTRMPADIRQEMIKRMLGDPWWHCRLLGLLALGSQPAELPRQQIASTLAKDPDESVRQVADGLIELMAFAAGPATQPASATQPVVGKPPAPVTQPAIIDTSSVVPSTGVNAWHLPHAATEPTAVMPTLPQPATKPTTYPRVPPRE